MTFKEIIEQLEKGDLIQMEGKFHVDNDTFIYKAWKDENPLKKKFIHIAIYKDKE